MLLLELCSFTFSSTLFRSVPEHNIACQMKGCVCRCHYFIVFIATYIWIINSGNFYTLSETATKQAHKHRPVQHALVHRLRRNGFDANDLRRQHTCSKLFCNFYTLNLFNIFFPLSIKIHVRRCANGSSS